MGWNVFIDLNPMLQVGPTAKGPGDIAIHNWRSNLGLRLQMSFHKKRLANDNMAMKWQAWDVAGT